MKFKFDENFGPKIQAVFQRRGTDYDTVRQEGLCGAPDDKVLQAAVREGRILVTMDHDFGNVVRFPPEKTAGVAILSVPERISMSLLQSMAEALIDALEKKVIRGKLWIVEPHRIREHEPPDIPGFEDDE